MDIIFAKRTQNMIPFIPLKITRHTYAWNRVLQQQRNIQISYLWLFSSSIHSVDHFDTGPHSIISNYYLSFKAANLHQRMYFLYILYTLYTACSPHIPLQVGWTHPSTSTYGISIYAASQEILYPFAHNDDDDTISNWIWNYWQSSSSSSPTKLFLRKPHSSAYPSPQHKSSIARTPTMRVIPIQCRLSLRNTHTHKHNG